MNDDFQKAHGYDPDDLIASLERRRELDIPDDDTIAYFVFHDMQTTVNVPAIADEEAFVTHAKAALELVEEPFIENLEFVGPQGSGWSAATNILGDESDIDNVVDQMLKLHKDPEVRAQFMGSDGQVIVPPSMG